MSTAQNMEVISVILMFLPLPSDILKDSDADSDSCMTRSPQPECLSSMCFLALTQQ